MTHWIREAFAAAKTIRQVRKSGETAKLALVAEEELIDSRNWLAKRDYENQLMQQCIIGTTRYQSICDFCEEMAECNKAAKGKRGCDGWWLRFLTKEEEERCEQRAAAQKDP